MIVSRTIAKRRIAAGARPSGLAAWGLVLIDALLLLAVFALIWGPVMRMIDVYQLSTGLTFLIFFVVYFVPLQVVLIIASLWASKSRWRDDPQREE